MSIEAATILPADNVSALPKYCPCPATTWQTIFLALGGTPSLLGEGRCLVAHKNTQSQRYALEISFRLRIKVRPQIGAFVKGTVAMLAAILAKTAKHFFHSG